MTPSSGALRALGALRANPAFRRCLAARAISMVGTLITAVVLPVLVYRLTGSVAWTAAVVVAEALPHLLLAGVAAPIATWLNRRRLLYLPELAGAALLGSIPLAWWGGALSGWHLLAVAGAVQALFVLLDAAQPGALRCLVGPELTATGDAVLRGSTGLVELMVPPLAGLAVAIVAPAPLLILDALSFLASALLVRAAIRSRPEPAPRPPRSAPRPAGRRERRERRGLGAHRKRWGVQRANPPSRAVVLGATLHSAAAAAYLAVLLPWADQQLDVPPSGDARLALVISCWGLGAIGGCSLSPELIRRLGPVRLLRRGAGMSLVCGLAVLVSTHWLAAVLAGLLWGAAHAVTMNAARHMVEYPVRPVIRMLWLGLGPATGAALAGTFAVWSTPRAGLAVGVTLLMLAALTVPRRPAPLPPGSVPVQPGPPRVPGREPTGREPPGGEHGDKHSPRTLADRAAHRDTTRATRDRTTPRAGA